MKNTILIEPVDEDMALLATAVLILNNFKKIGFVKREYFVELIMDVDKSYHTLPGMQKLNNFWAGRVKDAELNKDLVKIFEGLKTS
ncbi:hypothetical protein [Flavobacterium aestivum]|uniref:hypothetical protein n=1 Tax=Flavobacterium aestivum TaxID=3003257 RepID=UPI002286B050|nr:hypothetical protein [Flavobacterium aestivum]